VALLPAHRNHSVLLPPPTSRPTAPLQSLGISPASSCFCCLRRGRTRCKLCRQLEGLAARNRVNSMRIARACIGPQNGSATWLTRATAANSLKWPERRYIGSSVTMSRSRSGQVDSSLRKIHRALRLETANSTEKPRYPANRAPLHLITARSCILTMYELSPHHRTIPFLLPAAYSLPLCYPWWHPPTPCQPLCRWVTVNAAPFKSTS
jgi:hypothetical protein